MALPSDHPGSAALDLLGPPARRDVAPEPVSTEELALKFLQLLEYLGVSWDEDTQSFVRDADARPRSSQLGPENVEPVVTAGP